MDTQNWSPFTLGELFDIDTGKDLIYSSLTYGEYPVIGHKAENNGITTYTDKLDGYTLYNNISTISLGDRGSFFAAVQSRPFYIGTRVKALTAKFRSNTHILLFIATLINRESFRFSYGRNSCDRTEYIAIKLPSIRVKGELFPDFDYIENFTKEVLIPLIPPKSREVWNNQYTNRPISDTKIDCIIQDWQWFYIRNLFCKFEKCKCSNATEMLEDGTDIAYIGAKKSENGIMRYVKREEGLVTKGNCIVFIGDGQGSVGYCLYQPCDFIGSTTLIAGYMDNLNPYIAQFLVTILDMERYRYSFGRKYKKNVIMNSRIKLPTDENGNPDWQFMENYIKSLPYSSNL